MKTPRVYAQYGLGSGTRSFISTSSHRSRSEEALCIISGETDDLDALVARMKASGHEFRNAIREQPKFKYVMTAGPDDLLIELFQCHEPQRWQLKP